LGFEISMLSLYSATYRETRTKC